MTHWAMNKARTVSGSHQVASMMNDMTNELHRFSRRQLVVDTGPFPIEYKKASFPPHNLGHVLALPVPVHHLSHRAISRLSYRSKNSG